jgi:hypothetical protein
MKLVVSETVNVVGPSVGDLPPYTRMSIMIEFDTNGAQPNTYSPGMAMIVQQEAQQVVQRLLAKAKKATRNGVLILPPQPKPAAKKQTKRTK